jgi:hypothetical protein
MEGVSRDNSQMEHWHQVRTTHEIAKYLYWVRITQYFKRAEWFPGRQIRFDKHPMKKP